MAAVLKELYGFRDNCIIKKMLSCFWIVCSGIELYTYRVYRAVVDEFVIYVSRETYLPNVFDFWEISFAVHELYANRF